MKKESCYFFATISKSFKTDGTVIIKNNNGLKEIDILEPLFIEFNNIMVPFFLEEIDYRNDNSALARFETIRSEEQTADYIGREIYIEKKKTTENSYDINFIKGFSLFDQNENFVGEITDYQDIPNNPLLVIAANQKEILIPFHQDFVISFLEKEKKIVLEIMDGLTDL